MGFYRTVWDPKLIISQILTLQCLYYISLGFILFLLGFPFGSSVGVEIASIFSYHSIKFSTGSGRLTIIAFALNAILSAFFMVRIVERAKKCLDFSFTLHFVHFLACTCSFGFPMSWEWWLVTFLVFVLQCLLSEYLCMRREMRAISIDDAGFASPTVVTV